MNLKEAFQYIVSLGNKEVVEVNNRKFSTGELHLIHEPTSAPLEIHNLSGLVDYLKSDYDNQPPALVQVFSPTEVRVMSTFNVDKKRNHLLKVEALLPRIQFERYMDVESFNVQLQSCFVNSGDRAVLLQVTGNVTESEVKTVGDDGVSQQVTAKTGVGVVGNIVIPNPVVLAPFRTFTEVDQPLSQFVFRMQKGPQAALFEADGGAWKVVAVHAIRDYLAKELSALVEDGKVTIIA